MQSSHAQLPIPLATGAVEAHQAKQNSSIMVQHRLIEVIVKLGFDHVLEPKKDTHKFPRIS